MVAMTMPVANLALAFCLRSSVGEGAVIADEPVTVAIAQKK
jgi:hypothetical protein